MKNKLYFYAYLLSNTYHIHTYLLIFFATLHPVVFFFPKPFNLETDFMNPRASSWKYLLLQVYCIKSKINFSNTLQQVVIISKSEKCS